MREIENILHEFYASRIGRLVRRSFKRDIEKLWPNCRGLRVLGTGYAQTYIDLFHGCETDCCIALSYTNLKPNSTCSYARAERHILPLSKSSIDRVLMIHDLEFCSNIPTYMDELYRVIVPNGRILMIVPNRKSRWSRTEWSPFGFGAPFSRSHLLNYIEKSDFRLTHISHRLFIPPLRTRTFLKTARVFNMLGQIMPIFGGVHIVELTKSKISGTPVRVQPKSAKSHTGIIPPKTIPSARI